MQAIEVRILVREHVARQSGLRLYERKPESLVCWTRATGLRGFRERTAVYSNTGAASAVWGARGIDNPQCPRKRIVSWCNARTLSRLSIRAALYRASNCEGSRGKVTRAKTKLPPNEYVEITP